MKKTVCLIIAIATLISVLSGCGGQPSAQTDAPKATDSAKTFQFTMGTAVQDASPAKIAGDEFCKAVAEKTSGTVNIDFKPARTVGEDTELTQQVIDGTLDFAIVSTGIFSSYTPLLDTLQLPFLLNNYEKENEALLSPEMKAIYDAMDPLGVKVLGSFETGMRNVANNVRPISSVEDIKGLKIRILSSSLMMDTMTTLGASPTAMAFGEVYSGLQGKVIDGIDMGVNSMVTMKYFEVTKYYSVVGLYPYPCCIIMNLDSFNQMSEEQQQVVREVADEMVTFSIDYVKEHEDADLKTLEESGMVVNTVTDVSAFKEATSSIYDDYTAKDPLIKQFVEAWK